MNGAKDGSGDEAAPRGPIDFKVGGFRLVRKVDSDASVKALLPTEGSEDASRLLVLPEKPPIASGPGEGPDPKVDWAIDLEWVEPRRFSAKHVRALRQELIPDEMEASLYKYPDESGGWIRLAGGREDAEYSRLCFSVKLVRPSKEHKVLTLDDLSGLLEAVKAIGARLGASSVSPRTSVEEGSTRAQTLFRTWDEADWHVSISLRAPEGSAFEGKAVWDVLMSLGLRWGDMDLFHWENPLRDHGDDHLFSVWTSTGCGYFLPEEIAAGRLRVDDLVFGYSVPRSADPLGVLESMRRGIEYARHRLGGEIQDPETGKPVDWDHERRIIEGAIQTLKRGGFVPGEWSAMYLF